MQWSWEQLHPAINATLNLTCFVLLIGGRMAIARGDQEDGRDRHHDDDRDRGACLERARPARLEFKRPAQQQPHVGIFRGDVQRKNE